MNFDSKYHHCLGVVRGEEEGEMRGSNSGGEEEGGDVWEELTGKSGETNAVKMNSRERELVTRCQYFQSRAATWPPLSKPNCLDGRQGNI